MSRSSKHDMASSCRPTCTPCHVVLGRRRAARPIDTTALVSVSDWFGSRATRSRARTAPPVKLSFSVLPMPQALHPCSTPTPRLPPAPSPPSRGPAACWPHSPWVPHSPSQRAPFFASGSGFGSSSNAAACLPQRALNPSIASKGGSTYQLRPHCGCVITRACKRSCWMDRDDD